MTQVIEPVDIAFASEDDWSCPFSHARKKPPPIDNVMPPVDGKETNDSIKLGENLDDAKAGMEIIEVGFTIGKRAYDLDVQYTPHHLLPGNETWPKTKLLEWVDESKGTINGDIGYDVNDASNGVDLPGIHGLGDGAWSSASQAFQAKYAFTAMACSKPKRQFHDRHNAYSRFVVNSLDAIAQKLKAKGKSVPGCGKENCGGNKKKPYDPPFGLLTRLEGASDRLRDKLKADESIWVMPIYTSRFGVMYKTKPMTQEQAREALREARKKLE